MDSELRQKLEKMSSSYPEIKDVFNSILDKLGEPTEIKPDQEFLKELISLKGIGKSYAEDIIRVYPVKSLLVNYIKSNKILPFREDINKLLKSVYLTV